jgi:hypothetical protein
MNSLATDKSAFQKDSQVAMNTDSPTKPEDAYVEVKAPLLDRKAAIKYVRHPAQDGV